MRAQAFIDRAHRELLWATIEYRDELSLCCAILEQLADPERVR